MADIVDTAVSAGFDSLVAAVMATNLVNTLKGPGSFTAFAPIDNESAKLPTAMADVLLKDISKFTKILTY